MSKQRIGISMNEDQVNALNRVLGMLDSGEDTRIVRRHQDYCEARAIVARCAMRVRRGDVEEA